VAKATASDVVVFLGPTLARAQAAELLDAIYLPPADQGAVVRAVRSHQPRAIVLIDGSFGKVPAVRHKEILWALGKRINVFGAASMGALRAAELAPFGMQGHGFIHRWYSLTPLADDDEVAVAMSPVELGAAPLSEALINMRLTFRRAERCGILTRKQRRMLEALARDTHFVDRGYPRLLSDAGSALSGRSGAIVEALREWLPTNAVDKKRDDAIGLLKQLAQRPDLRLTQHPRTFPFRLTEAWAYDLEDAGLWGDDILSA
jgi:hypothetical protein